MRHCHRSDRNVLNLPFEFDFTKKLYSLKCPCDSIFGIPHFYILVKSMTLLLNYPQNSGNRISGTKKIKQFSRAVDPLGRHHYQSCKKHQTWRLGLGTFLVQKTVKHQNNRSRSAWPVDQHEKKQSMLQNWQLPDNTLFPLCQWKTRFIDKCFCVEHTV